MERYDHGISGEEIRQLVGQSPIMLEIGSHNGSDTASFLEAMPEMRLFCFEPDQRPIASFKETIGDDSRVTLYEKAVADVDGALPFYASTGKAGGFDDWDFSGSLCEPTGHRKYSPAITFKAPAPVPCVRLDTWYTETLWPGTPIDFIWADCQGAQRQLLAGAATTLGATRYLYIEAHNRPYMPLYEGEPTQSELIALLPGFQPLAVYERDNVLFCNGQFAGLAPGEK